MIRRWASHRRHLYITTADPTPPVLVVASQRIRLIEAASLTTTWYTQGTGWCGGCNEQTLLVTVCGDWDGCIVLWEMSSIGRIDVSSDGRAAG